MDQVFRNEQERLLGKVSMVGVQFARIEPGFLAFLETCNLYHAR